MVVVVFGVTVVLLVKVVSWEVSADSSAIPLLPHALLDVIAGVAGNNKVNNKYLVNCMQRENIICTTLFLCMPFGVNGRKSYTEKHITFIKSLMQQTQNLIKSVMLCLINAIIVFDRFVII